MGRKAEPATPYRLLLVEWHDSCSHGDAWAKVHNLEDESFLPGPHISVGWEFRRHDTALTLAPNLGWIAEPDNFCVSGLFTIPLTAIDSETILIEASSDTIEGKAKD